MNLTLEDKLYWVSSSSHRNLNLKESKKCNQVIFSVALSLLICMINTIPKLTTLKSSKMSLLNFQSLYFFLIEVCSSSVRKSNKKQTEIQKEGLLLRFSVKITVKKILPHLNTEKNKFN